MILFGRSQPRFQQVAFAKSLLISRYYDTKFTNKTSESQLFYNSVSLKGEHV